jgi:hypothetical protein
MGMADERGHGDAVGPNGRPGTSRWPGRAVDARVDRRADCRPWLNRVATFNELTSTGVATPTRARPSWQGFPWPGSGQSQSGREQGPCRQSSGGTPSRHGSPRRRTHRLPLYARRDRCRAAQHHDPARAGGGAPAPRYAARRPRRGAVHGGRSSIQRLSTSSGSRSVSGKQSTAAGGTGSDGDKDEGDRRKIA